MDVTEKSSGYVFLLEDDNTLREHIADILRCEGYQVISWGSAGDFLKQIPIEEPVVIVTDMRMPGMSGCDLHAELHRLGYDMPVIYISGESTVPQAIQAMKQGALEFLLKPFGRDELLASVASAIQRYEESRQFVAVEARVRASLASLSPRQREVAGLLLRGFGNRELVNSLGISLATAKQYKSEVMKKLGVSSLSQLISVLNVRVGEGFSRTDR